jgi:WD40 repeat protein
LYVKSLAASPVAREFVAISQDSQELVKYDLDSGMQVAVCPSEFNSAVYSPDGGERVLFGTDSSSPGPALRRVDAKTMKPVGDDVTWSSPFLTVAINRSRDVLLSGGRKGELVLWDYRTMHRLSTPFYQASRDGAKWSRINATSVDAGGTIAIAGTTRDSSYESGQIEQAQREIRRWQIRKSGTPSSELRESVEGRTGMRLELATGRITGLTLEQWMGRMANTRPPVGHVAPTMPSSAK